MSGRHDSQLTRLLRHTVRLPVQAWQLSRRVVGYVLSSSDDVRAVYGDDPKGLREESNVSGNVAANTIGGFGQ
jgi:hypothetical protein